MVQDNRKTHDQFLKSSLAKIISKKQDRNYCLGVGYNIPFDAISMISNQISAILVYEASEYFKHLFGGNFCPFIQFNNSADKYIVINEKVKDASQISLFLALSYVLFNRIFIPNTEEGKVDLMLIFKKYELVLPNLES